MASPLLALFARSLREDQRQKATYFARVGLVLLILFFLFGVRQTFGWGNAPGLRFFRTVIYLDFFFILLAGVSHFASSVTEEKEEMTLGLLRMTNLNPLSILLGKSTSRMVGALLLLAAQFPFTLLAVSFGGVSVGQIVAAYCSLGALIVLLANLALLFSVICRRTTGAAVLTGLTLFAVYIALPFLRWVAMMPVRIGLIEEPSALLRGVDRVADAVALASPTGRLSEVLETGFMGGPMGVQGWSNVLVGIACFLVAWAVFDVFCGEQQESTQPRSLVARRTSPLRLLGAGRAWSAALAWKDFHFLTGGRSWLLLKLGLYAVPPLLFYLIPQRWNATLPIEVLGIFSFWFALLALHVEACFLAASVFRVERQWKTLSSLAMLPLSIAQIAIRKVLGCLPALIPGLVCLGFGLACMHFASPGLVSRTASRLFDSPQSGLLLALWIACVIGFLHLIALLSIWLKRGALPVAIGLAMVIGILVSVLNFLHDGSEVAARIACLSVLAGGTAAMHWQIGRRLEQLAAED